MGGTTLKGATVGSRGVATLGWDSWLSVRLAHRGGQVEMIAPPVVSSVSTGGFAYTCASLSTMVPFSSSEVGKGADMGESAAAGVVGGDSSPWLDEWPSPGIHRDASPSLFPTLIFCYGWSV